MMALLGIVLIVVLVICSPFAAIWAVNTLFGTVIAFTFKTWCASLILGGVMGGAGYSRK